jgi:hypothetical protein
MDGLRKAMEALKICAQSHAAARDYEAWAGEHPKREDASRVASDVLAAHMAQKRHLNGHGGES